MKMLVKKLKMKSLKIVKSELPLTEYAPSYKYFVFENIITKVDFKKVSDFILKKEKEIVEKFPTNGDGDTGLGDSSLTARFKQFNVFEWVGECQELKIIQKSIIENLEDLINSTHTSMPNLMYIQCWANVMRKGQEIKIHSHSSDAFSYFGGNIVIKAKNTKTYYVNPLKYFDTIGRKNNIIESENVVGKLTLFNNYIPHYTDKQIDDDERITIAFDLIPFVPKTETKNYIRLY